MFDDLKAVIHICGYKEGKCVSVVQRDTHIF